MQIHRVAKMVWRVPSALAIVAASTLATGACDLGNPRSGRGFHLPDGNIERGAVAFQELGCRRCHAIAGEALSASGGPNAAGGANAGADDRALLLGGPVTRVETYGELVTSIIHPSHEISRPVGRTDAAIAAIEMTDSNTRMTVAQLIDLVAFLQSSYERRPAPQYVR